MSATLASFSSPQVVTISSEASAHHAAQLMREHHVGSLVVVNANAPKGSAKPMGIITDRDLVLAVMAEGLDAALFTVGDVMSVDLVTAPASADLLDAVNLRRQNRVRRISDQSPVWRRRHGLRASRMCFCDIWRGIAAMRAGL